MELTSPAVIGKTGSSMLMVRTLSAQEDLRALITAVLPVLQHNDSFEQSDLFKSALLGLGMDASSDRDLALLAGAVQSARLIALTAESLGEDPSDVWQSILQAAQR